jgi:hypothetical protein
MKRLGGNEASVLEWRDYMRDVISGKPTTRGWKAQLRLKIKQCNRALKLMEVSAKKMREAKRIMVEVLGDKP